MNGKRRDLLTSSVINTNIETITPASIGNIVKDQNALRTAMANNDGSDDKYDISEYDYMIYHTAYII